MAKRKKKIASPKLRAAKQRRSRSDAAKRGWITRRRNEKLKRQPPKRTPPKRKRRQRQPAHVEYAVNVNYRVKGKHNAISLQFSVIAAPNLTASEVQEIIINTIENEGESPIGTKVKIVDWKGGRVPSEIPWGKLAIIANEPPTRFRVSHNRSR